MTKILQITDTHLATGDTRVSGRLDTDKRLQQLIDRLNHTREHWGTIDAVVVTGDVSDDGSPDSYQRIKKILASLNLPVFVIPGNHDAREPMREAFKEDGYLPNTGPLNWQQRIGDINVIGLDTLVEGKGSGLLTPDTLDYLRAQLLHATDVPTIVAMHHPPFDTGINFMDAIHLNNTHEFASVIAEAQTEVRIICGHVHNMMVASVKRHVAVSAPAPCSSFEFDLRKNATVGFYDRDDGCLLHCWREGFQSIRIGPQTGSGPHPFNP